MPAVFSPADEPYLGTPSLFVFDRMISATMAANDAWARYSRTEGLAPIQKVATQIIPHSISITLSIRELIRQGYLLSGEILVRPLVERVAVLGFLQKYEDKISLWEAGWPHKSRPKLRDMLKAMVDGMPDMELPTDEVIKHIIDGHNALIHADPVGSCSHLSMHMGQPTFSASKVLDDAPRCDRLSKEVVSYLAILTCKAISIFPEAR